jgi:hypothetical protein
MPGLRSSVNDTRTEQFQKHVTIIGPVEAQKDCGGCRVGR